MQGAAERAVFHGERNWRIVGDAGARQLLTVEQHVDVLVVGDFGCHVFERRVDEAERHWGVERTVNRRARREPWDRFFAGLGFGRFRGATAATSRAPPREPPQRRPADDQHQRHDRKPADHFRASTLFRLLAQPVRNLGRIKTARELRLNGRFDWRSDHSRHRNRRSSRARSIQPGNCKSFLALLEFGPPRSRRELRRCSSCRRTSFAARSGRE